MLSGMNRTFAIAPLVLGFSFWAFASCRSLGGARGDGDGITRAEIEAHVRYLASDEMRGRMTGSPESARAAEYIAGALAEAGVRPAGEGGSFLEPVPIVRLVMRALPALEIVTAAGETISAEPGADFEVSADALSAGPLPVVAAASREALPASADPGAALFVDGSVGDRRQWLRDAGLGDGAGFGLLLRPGSDERRSKMKELPPPSRLRLDAERAPRRPSWITVHGPVLALFRAGAVASATLRMRVEKEAVAAHNVIGVIPGRPAEGGGKAAEALVLTAHYDHIGTAREPASDGADTDTDTVFNGADDDASGVAAVMEIAEEIAAGPAPERTVVVLLVTGEEVGLLGTEAYLDAPAIPLARTVANLNFEMVGRPDELAGGSGALWLTGYELTNLGAAFAAASLRVAPDPRPEQNFFRRSDNFAFVRRGVVAQSLSSFNLHADYHRTSDEADLIDFAHMEAATRAAFRAVRLVADGAVDPAWIGEPPAAR